MKVRRLADVHAEALEELLMLDPVVNLFLLGYMDALPIGRAHWFGALDGDRLLGALLLVPDRLAVPFCPDPEHARALGRLLARRRHRPCMVVGPRDASDAMWAAWAGDRPVDRWYNQRLYVCDEPLAGERLPGFRRAHPREWEQVAEHAARMEEEDLGRRPRDEDPERFDDTVRRRIEQGSTWVIEREGTIRFQIHVGTHSPWGVQVGGTYVPPPFRGHGLATAGMLELGRRLLPRAHAITLHVNEANTPAVRTYERSGYRPHAAYRLITLPS